MLNRFVAGRMTGEELEEVHLFGKENSVDIYPVYIPEIKEEESKNTFSLISRNYVSGMKKRVAIYFEVRKLDVQLKRKTCSSYICVLAKIPIPRQIHNY